MCFFFYIKSVPLAPSKSIINHVFLWHMFGIYFKIFKKNQLCHSTTSIRADVFKKIIYTIIKIFCVEVSIAYKHSKLVGLYGKQNRCFPFSTPYIPHRNTFTLVCQYFEYCRICLWFGWELKNLGWAEDLSIIVY